MTEDTKCSIIHKYSEDEARRLQKEGDLPSNFKLNLDDFETVEDEDESGFIMDQPSDSDSDSESSEEEIDLDEI